MIKASFLGQVQFFNGKTKYHHPLAESKAQTKQVRRFLTTFSNHLIVTGQDPMGPSQNRTPCPMSSALPFVCRKTLVKE